MNVTSVTLGGLVDSTLMRLQDARGVPASTALAGALTASAGDNSLTFTNAAQVNVGDVLEVGTELMHVTAKTDDAVPVVTVNRAYYTSSLATHDINDTVLINPRYSRVRVAEAIQRSFARIESKGVPMTETTVLNRETDLRWAELPANTRDVLRVGYIDPITGTWTDLPKWRFIDDVPTSEVSTGKMLKLWRAVRNEDDLIVTRRIPYRWSTYPAAPTEDATVSMIEGTEDLPALYATAWLLGGREIARTEIDRAEEWNQGEPSRGGVSMGLVRAAWQDFFRHLDDAKSLYPTLPLHRPYLRTPR